MFVGLSPTVLVDQERGTVFVGLRPTVLVDQERGTVFVGLCPTVLVDQERGTVFVGLRPTVLVDQERGTMFVGLRPTVLVDQAEGVSVRVSGVHADDDGGVASTQLVEDGIICRPEPVDSVTPQIAGMHVKDQMNLFNAINGLLYQRNVLAV